MNISMILSGGSGSRFGDKLPKQYHRLLGKEIISYSIDALKKSSQTNAILLICDPSYAARLTSEYGVPCIDCGASRNESLKNGLDYIMQEYGGCSNVFITEAARPFLTGELVDAYLENLKDFDAVITAKKITDSLGKKGEAVTYRDDYYLIQAPEAFRFDLLYKNFKADSKITATVQQLPPERKTLEYYGFKFNLKITYPEDMVIAEQLMKLQLSGTEV